MRKNNLHFLVFLTIMLISCEDVYDKESRYEAELDERVNQELSPDIKNKIFEISEEDTILISKFPYVQRDLTNKKISVINWTQDKNADDAIAFNHRLNRKIIAHGYPVTYNLDSVDYFLVSEMKFDKVGEYVDENGDYTQDANVNNQYLFLYDTKMKIWSLIAHHKSDEPKEKIKRGEYHYETGITGDWDPEDYLNFLILNKFYAKPPDSLINKRFYSEEFVDYLEKNNYVIIN